MAARKERVHNHGQSNRQKCWTAHAAVHGDQPINFDSSLRSLNSRMMAHSMDTFVPLGALEGSGNKDFAPQLPGHDYRQPRCDPMASATLKKELTQALAQTLRRQAEKPETSIAALDRLGHRVDDPERYKPRPARQKGQRVAPRWNPAKWHEDPPEERAPLQKEEGETWNSMESQKIQGRIQGRDRLNRTVRRPEDVGTPRSEGAGDPSSAIDFDHEEYYPGRSAIDGAAEEPGADFQIRPINLPDFNNPRPRLADSTTRMQRLRELLRQRYAGRPRLIKVFRNCALHKPGFVFAKDMQMVFDQMGIKVEEPECEMLIAAVDKDQKGACNFEEFADLIYGGRVNVGGPDYEPKERHVRHMTNVLVDRLVSNGQALGKAFCDLDPERQYLVSKAQFTNALGAACNHMSKQAVEFLWAAQFSGESQAADLENRCVDWRSFMSQLAHYAHENRPPTPCTFQGRKRQYDLLQRSAAVTGGYLPDMDLHRPDQDPDEKIIIKADKLCYRPTDLLDMPRDVSFFTEPYLEDIRVKAWRCEKALPQQVHKARMKMLLTDRKVVHQDDLVDMIFNELQTPGLQDSLPPQAPLYSEAVAGAGVQVMNLDGPQSCAALPAKVEAPERQQTPAQRQPAGLPQGEWGSQPKPVSLHLNRADIKAYVSRQLTNRVDEVDVNLFLHNLYMPEDERKVMHTVNDGLNRHIRGLRPPRERPPSDDLPRHENYWQARYMMELLGDSIATVESSNGGRLKSSKMFKRLDMDNDGYISLSDLQVACDKYKVPHCSADLHALFSQLDKADKGSINIGEFTRHYEMHQGNLLDAMSRSIRAVNYEGGVQYAGPLQDTLDARDESLALKHAAAGRASSAPAGKLRVGSSGASSSSHQMPVVIDTSAGVHGRVSDVMRSRYNQWKAHKSELYTTAGKTRFGMTVHPDTRHITEPSVPMAASFMDNADRFKTTNNTFSIFATPDPNHSQTRDAMQKHGRNEFKVERLRSRQREFTERCWAANQAVQEFDDKKIARKALTQINYERRVKMSCC